MKAIAFLTASMTLAIPATAAFAARLVTVEPPPGTLMEGATVYYRSNSCSRENRAKPFKVLTSRNGRRITVGCFTEADAKTQ